MQKKYFLFFNLYFYLFLHYSLKETDGEIIFIQKYKESVKFWSRKTEIPCKTHTFSF